MPVAARTGVATSLSESGLLTLAAGADAVGTTVFVMAPLGTGMVTVTVTGVAAQPELQTVVVA